MKMRRIILFVILLQIQCLSICAQKIDKSVIFPVVKENQSQSLLVRSVVVSNDSTSLEITVNNALPSGEAFGWISLNPNARIEANGKSYKLEKSYGIALEPGHTLFSEVGEEKTFRLTFPPIDKDVSEIDFIESDQSSWKLYGIDLTRNVNTHDSVSAIMSTILVLRSAKGDLAAKKYAEQTRSVFERNNAMPTYSLYWGMLVSNVWNENPESEVKNEYRIFLTRVFDEDVCSDEFLPQEDMLEFFWQFAHDYAIMLFKDKDYEACLKYLRIIHRWYKAHPDKQLTTQYARNLLDICLVLVRDMNRREEGMPYCKEYTDISKQVYGDTSAEYATSLYNLSACYGNFFKRDEARKILRQAIQIYEKAPNGNPKTLDTMRREYNAEVALVTGTTDVANTVRHDTDSLDFVECCVLVESGRGKEALPALYSIREQTEQQAYMDSLRYISLENMIVLSLIQTEEYSLAQKEIDQFNGRFGIDNLKPEYAQVFYGMAGLIAFKLNHYDAALRYYAVPLNYYEKTDTSGPEYAKVLTSVAMIFHEQGDFRSARLYSDKAVDALGNTKESDNAASNIRLTVLGNSAMIYASMGMADKAIDTYKYIIDNFKDNPNCSDAVILAINNLAAVYLKAGKYKQCIELLEPIIDNPSYAAYSSQNLALAYYLAGSKQVEKPLRMFCDILKEQCLDVSSYFPNADREALMTYNALSLTGIPMVALKFPSLTDLAYDNILFSKNLSLKSGNLIREMAEDCKIPGFRENYHRVCQLRDSITYDAESKDSVSSWYKELRAREQNLNQAVPQFQSRLSSSFSTWKKIQASLEEGDMAIEFLLMPILKRVDVSDATINYGAIVLRKEDENPLIIDLGEDSDIENAMALSGSDALDISLLYNRNDSLSVYNLIWKRLEPYMRGKKNIYFSPVGVLNTVNHSAIMAANGKRLGELYNMYLLSSTDEIANCKQQNNADYKSAVVYGGINYDESILEMRQMAAKYRNVKGIGGAFVVRGEEERGRWNLLEGTKLESDSVSAILKASSVASSLLQWNEANEESFKNLNGNSPSIIHLSTHGFYIDTHEKRSMNPFMHSLGSYSQKEDNMTHCGLLLAGANNVWTGKAKMTGAQDGVLTADEIGRLDLSKTKLVVLSACETAQGYIDDIDGVLGLQRGFKKAGVQSIVMSLWKVPDAATAALMEKFYTYLMRGYSVRESLCKAQESLQRTSPLYSNPYYWAAFVVLD